MNAVDELRRYIAQEYDGKIDDALASIGGLRIVRKILGLPDYAVLDSRLYRLPDEGSIPETERNCSVAVNRRNYD